MPSSLHVDQDRKLINMPSTALFAIFTLLYAVLNIKFVINKYKMRL